MQGTLVHQAPSPADTAAMVYIRVRLLPVPGSFKHRGAFPTVNLSSLLFPWSL